MGNSLPVKSSSLSPKTLSESRLQYTNRKASRLLSYSSQGVLTVLTILFVVPSSFFFNLGEGVVIGNYLQASTGRSTASGSFLFVEDGT
jgi:hypothetical protein